MKKFIHLTNLIILVFSYTTLAQDFTISNTRARYDGNKLSVEYDLTSKKQSDLFFILLEITDKDGTPVRASTFRGDIGEKINPGINKSIVWVPEDDAVFLNDTVTVEIKGEKHEMSFNRGGVFMSSLILPGLGQTKITEGSPWWLAGIAAYGSLAGGFIFNSKYRDNLDAYQVETDPLERSDLYDRSQSDKKISQIFFISAGALWAGNMIWVAVAPNDYKELKLPGLSLYTAPAYGSRVQVTMFALTFDF